VPARRCGGRHGGRWGHKEVGQTECGGGCCSQAWAGYLEGWPVIPVSSDPLDLLEHN